MLQRVSFQVESKCVLQHVAERLCVKHERESKDGKVAFDVIVGKAKLNL